MTAARTPAVGANRKAFYDKIGEGNCTPLWEVLANLLSATPNTPCKPYLWAWDTLWPWIEESGTLITAREAERRVLVLENPGLRGQTRITHSLYAGLQLILPGETAPAHRHSQSALRFILHGAGAYTAIDGRKVFMNVGDFVITPSWCFHDHGNPTTKPMVWLDGLDLPLVALLDAQFMERGAEDPEHVDQGLRDNLAQFGNSMRPMGHRQATRTSPVMSYPYDRTREALEALRNGSEPHPCFGYRIQYVNPVTGGWAMPTIGTCMQLLSRGFAGRPYRSTDSTVFAVVEGRGNVEIGGRRMTFGPRDIFVCPSWMPYTLQADDDCVLFNFSDRPVQEALDLWREAF